MIDHEDLIDILESIKEEKCVLFLGPLVGLPQDELPLHKIVHELGVLQNENIHYYQEEQLLHFKEKHIKQRFYRNIKRLYRDVMPVEIHQKIAQIPFDVVISIAPDLRLRKAYEQMGVKHIFRYYSLKENPTNFAKPSQEQPLIYNLFGSIEDEESLIYTNDELFEFIFAILGGKKLPIELRNELEEANNFLFLGCDFEIWYMRIILRLFNLHEDNFYAYSANNVEKMRESTKVFYMKHFRMKFVHQNIDEFVNNLHQLCQEENILREKIQNNSSPKQQSIELITQGKIDEAIAYMTDYFQRNDNTDAYYEMVGIANRQSDLKRRINEASISEENINIQKVKITNLLLELTKQME